MPDEGKFDLNRELLDIFIRKRTLWARRSEGLIGRRLKDWRSPMKNWRRRLNGWIKRG